MTDGDSVIVTSNTFRENNYGLNYISEEEYLQVDGNKFVSESGVPGVAINIKRKFVNGETNIFNNTISGINYKALFLDEVLHPKIEHNSFSISSGNLSLAPIRLSDSYDITFQNNIIQHKGSSGWFIEFDTITTIKMDNNLYYSPNELDTFIYTANNIAYSLAEWKEIQTGLETNSLYLNEAAPFVDSSNDLHIDCSHPLPIQATITKITTDIDGDFRKGFVNVGADQTNYSYERLNAEVYDICDGDSVFLEAKIIDGAVYDWRNGAKESGLYHSDSGSYLATTFSACVAFEQPFEVVVSHMPVADFSYTITDNSTVECKNKSINGKNYTWDMGDGSIYTSEDVVHTYTSTGSYEVLLVVDNECFTNSVAQVVNLETSPFFTPQGKKYAVISIFPTRVESFVQLASVQEGVYSLKILDVCGRVVLDKNNLIINEAGLRIDVSGLRPGIYFVAYYNKKTGSIKHSKKILKQ